MSENARAGILVLAAEDNEDDAFILRRAFAKASGGDLLLIVPDGRGVAAYLSGEGVYGNREIHPLPGLVLLDLKMPYMNGFEVLEWLSQRPQFKEIPAVVLSSSCHEADMQKARQLGASDFYTKPISFANWVGLMEALVARWLPKNSNTTVAADAPSEMSHLRH